MSAALTIETMSARLGQLRASQGLGDEHRAAAGRAEELLRAFRAGANLGWDTDAAGLHDLALRQGYATEPLLAMLQRLCDAVSPAGMDSCNQEMVKVRAALIEQARAVLAEAKGGAA